MVAQTLLHPVSGRNTSIITRRQSQPGSSQYNSTNPYSPSGSSCRGRNVFAAVKQQAVQASTEMLISSRPEVIIELLYGDNLKRTDPAKELRAWEAVPSVPAVRSHRISALTGDEFVVPGPRVVDATRKLAHALHPDVFP